jgi:hypothetical protein
VSTDICLQHLGIKHPDDEKSSYEITGFHCVAQKVLRVAVNSTLIWSLRPKGSGAIIRSNLRAGSGS